jgi:hypothetical protein
VAIVRQRIVPYWRSASLQLVLKFLVKIAASCLTPHRGGILTSSWPLRSALVVEYTPHTEYDLHKITCDHGTGAVAVSLKWRLHFEFVTSKTTMPKLRSPTKPDSAALWHGPSQLEVETMVWDLPIKVFATNPAFVSSVSQLRTETSCTL